jgi:hypothetical protein
LRNMRVASLLLVTLGISCAPLIGLTDAEEIAPDASAGASGAAAAGGAGGAVNCWPGQKLCSEKCYDQDAPEVGCNSTGCAPCNVPNATAKCEGWACVIDACDAGWVDCDEAELDHHVTGCEVNVLTEVQHCGACGNDCLAKDPEKNWECVDGVCQVSICESCHANCSGDGTTCIALDTVQDCGGCGKVCNLANAVAKCTIKDSPACGACEIDTCSPTHYANCDLVAGNGCEIDTNEDDAHCGGCGTKCTWAPASGTPKCINGKCDFFCNVGSKCGGGTSGSCVNLTNDNNNCGTCGTVCTGGRVCQNSACVCPTGQTFCGSTCQDCSGGKICQSGTCQCPTGQTFCGSTCQDCSGGKSCQSGVCTCPSGTKFCSGPQQCRQCCAGSDCSGGKTCQAGSCACPSTQPVDCFGVCRECCLSSHCAGASTVCCDGVCMSTACP